CWPARSPPGSPGSIRSTSSARKGSVAVTQLPTFPARAAAGRAARFDRPYAATAHGTGPWYGLPDFSASIGEPEGAGSSTSPFSRV
ncbi:MAG: hypothetical protein AVDCRST_MAG66-2422, partial [uncultured Pseudonocardia sp.]